MYTGQNRITDLRMMLILSDNSQLHLPTAESRNRVRATKSAATPANPKIYNMWEDDQDSRLFQVSHLCVNGQGNEPGLDVSMTH